MNTTNTTTELYGSPHYDNDGEEEEEDYRESMIGVIPTNIYIGVIYFILAFGSLGNSCIFALMQDREFRNLSYSVYLRVLAVSDSFLLVAVGTEDIIDHQFYRLDEFLTLSMAFCKFWTFFSQSLKLISPWLVVSMTFDRFVAVAFPLKRSGFCCRRTALIVCAVVVGVALAESVFFPVLMIIRDGECNVPDWESLRNYAIVRSVFLETTIPCVLILLLNLYIIFVINRSRRFRAAATSGSRQPGQEKSSRIDPATLSLMAVSIMAFVTLVPICILQVTEWGYENKMRRLESEFDPNNTDHIQEIQSLDQLLYDIGDFWPALNLVYLCNFAHNFYIMVLSGAKYRKKVASWFQCFSCLRRTQPSAGSTNRDTQETKVGREKS